MTRTLDELVDYLQQLLGVEYAAFAAAPLEPPGIRLNPLKRDPELFRARLREWQIDARPHPVNPDGLILEQDELPLSHTLHYFTGDFIYQGLSSQLPALALDPQPGESVLDLCAAPGSKSTQIAALMQNRGRLLLNDSSNGRLQPLMSNLFAAGVLNAALINLPGQLLGRLMPEQFDRVLVDAPCSALGNMPARAGLSAWSRAWLNKISTIQEQLLISAIKAAKVGGVIVYSTCSICPEEDEMVLEHILERYPVELEKIPFAGAPCCRPPLSSYQGHTFAAGLKHAVRIHPWPLPFEGFFVARLRKTGPLPIRPVNQAMTFAATLPGTSPEIRPVLEHLEEEWGIPVARLADCRFIKTLHRLWAVAPEWEQVPLRTFMMAGLPLAIQKTRFWRLTNASVQWLADDIHYREIDFSPDQVSALFGQGQIPAPPGPLRYHILRLAGRPVACIAQADGCYRIQLPHHFQLIL